MIFLVPPFISWFIRTHLKYFIQSSFCITLKYFPHCKRKRKQNWWMVCNKVENQINRQLPQKLGFYSATAAAAAKSLQSCPTLCDPIDGSPPGSPVPGILQARTLEWVAISFSNAWKWKVKVKSLNAHPNPGWSQGMKATKLLQQRSLLQIKPLPKWSGHNMASAGPL